MTVVYIISFLLIAFGIVRILYSSIPAFLPSDTVCATHK